MAKLGEIKTKIIKRGYEQDYTFKDNVCPCCGNISNGVYSIKNVTYYSLLFYKYKGRQAEIHCRECGTNYQKEILDEKVFLPLKEIIGNIILFLLILSFIIGVICFIASIVLKSAPMTYLGGVLIAIAIVCMVIIGIMSAEEE